ncbi:Crp/Fnr family transcriptional regulator [soil metagenome]
MVEPAAVNILIHSLSPDLRGEFEGFLTPTNFNVGHIFSEPGELVEYLYFLDSGMMSAVSEMEGGETVEAYMVGREGFTGTTAWLIPFTSPVRYVAQIAGSARRIEAGKFRQFANEHEPLRTVMAGYEAALHAELARSAPCNAVHRADQRLAKWLLRARDRADSDELRLTQDLLGKMLGAQRTTVNVIAQKLEAVGAIRCLRGKVRIEDRTRLEAASCECYDERWGVADRRARP